MRVSKIIISACILLYSSTVVNAQWLWDINKLSVIKTELKAPAYSDAYAKLLSDAEKALKEKPYSVTYKETIPPSGDKHDYVSLSRYWWPDPTKENGLPYIHKDGQSNPDLDKYDRNRLGEMCYAVNTLCLAYFYSNDERYAVKAVEFIRIWFLNSNTRMNPNLNYSQFVPGRDESRGRPEGLIDSYSFVEMLSSIELLNGYKGFTEKDKKELREWFGKLAEWFRTSELGKKEDAAKNNHGTSFDSQLVTYLAFSGNIKDATRVINEFPEKRLLKHIEPDGKQPNELWRTLAFHYSIYNLNHMLDLFAIAKKLGIDIYKTESSDGRSFYKAVDYLVTFLGKDVSDWPYKQISGWDEKQQDLSNLLYRTYALDPSRTNYLALYKKYTKNESTNRLLLLYGIENSLITQVFSFADKQLSFAITCVDKALAKSPNKDLVTPRTEEKDGELRLVRSGDWCSGFFPGELWYMYEYTKDEKWKKEAQRFTAPIEKEKLNGRTHDMGFKIYCSVGNGYRLAPSSHYRDVLIQSANTLITRYNPKVQAIRSWDHSSDKWDYPVIIDNMLNLELLFEASKLTNDPKYYQIADKHAATTLKNHFRDDFSTYHVVGYDTITGQPVKKNTHQGYSHESAWARGQAWGIYGYTMCYRYTKNTAYLKQAENIAGYIFNNPNLPEDLIPYWDFNDPAIPNAPRDASAACVTASALYELAQYSPLNKAKYIQLANTIINNLSNRYMAPLNTHQGFLLLHSTGNYPKSDEIDAPIVYADYYFLEAMLRKQKIEQTGKLF